MKDRYLQDHFTAVFELSMDVFSWILLKTSFISSFPKKFSAP